MAFDVASGLQVSESEIRAYPASKLVERLDWIIERDWNKTRQQISATQVGVMRALALGLGKKGAVLPDLPTFEQVLREQHGEAAPLPDWMVDFEQANPGRALLIASQQRDQHGGQ